MRLRSAAVLAGFAATLLAAGGAFANPAITPEVLQCDGGTYLQGGATHSPRPAIQAVVQDPTGLRVGHARMGVTSTNQTFSLWRFDQSPANVAVVSSCTADTTGYCPGGNCDTFQYDYNDGNGSTVVILGSCVYGTASCAAPSYNGHSTAPSDLLPPVPAGLASCPNSFPTAGLQTNYFPLSSGYTPASPLVYAGNGALPLNGSQFAFAYPQQGWLLSGTYTLSAWFQTAAGAGSASTMTIISYNEGFHGSGYQDYWGLSLKNGQLQMDDSRDTPTSAGADVVAGPALNDGNWHQVSVVRVNGATRRLFADGVLVGAFPAISTGSFSWVTYSSVTNSSATIVDPIIGAEVSLSTDSPSPVQFGPPTSYFTGQIDEIRVVGAALSDEDVRLEYLGSNLHQYAGTNASAYAVAAGGFAGSVPNGDAAAAYYFPGEAISTKTVSGQRWLFEAQSTQTVSTILSTFTVVIDQTPPTAPVGLVGTPAGTNAISWAWAAPSHFCQPPGSSSVYYQLYDAVNGGALSAPGAIPWTTQNFAETAGSSNTLHAARVNMTDDWGTGPLTASASAYTLAAVPSGLTIPAASISTGSFTATWSPNGNPAYTRYELSYSADPAFAVGVSTPFGLAANFTGSSFTVGGLASGQTYYARVRAFNGQSSDYYGGVPSGFASTSVLTIPPAPALSGAALSNSAIQWSWSSVPGATSYTLYDAPTQAVLYGGAGLSFTSSTLSVNQMYSAEVEASPPAVSSPSLGTHAFTTAVAYTLANPPIAGAVSAVSTFSASFAWSPNGNPAGTFYQVFVAQNPSFSVVTATLTASAPAAAVTGLLPGVTYYSVVQAVSGSQVATSSSAFSAFTTFPNPAITVSASPNTPYALTPGLVGSWQFAEGSGTVTADISGNGDAANFLCATAGCVSTPTWAAGPPGLGSAASFSGLTQGVVLTNAGLNVAGSLSVEAWFNAATAAQIAGAGLVAAGPKNSEDFALDVSAAGDVEFLTSSAGVELPVTSVAAAMAPGKWMHVAGVYDSEHGTAALYVNGFQVATRLAVPARANNHPPLAIGDREDASSSFTLPFHGRVASVRILNIPLSAAQVLADYQGAFVSSVTAPAPNAGIILALPANAFGAPAEIYISANPVIDPIRVSPTALIAGLANPPSGLTLVPGSLVEVVPIVDGQPFTAPLGSSATLTIPYPDQGDTGIITGTNPPLTAAGIRMYTLNTAVNSWALLPTTVDAASRNASGVTPHFSVFALFAPQKIASTLGSARVYPVPWKPGSGGRFDAPGVTFAGLPASGSIRILTLGGRRVRDFDFNGLSAGGAVWDGTNDDGRRAASGVYFARIVSGVDGTTTLVKFAIER
ncbi:MAG: LamG-like jellyroll fold domain-containing protein [Elusimicrobiota bacterium]